MTGPWNQGGQDDGSQQPGQQGQAPYGQNPYGQAPYGQAPYGQNPYGQAPYGQAPYGQAPYGQNPYGQAPYGQNPYGQQAGWGAMPGGPQGAPPDPPKEVQTAFWLWIAALTVGVLGSLLSLTMLGGAAGRLDSELASSTARSVARAGIIAGVVFGLLFVALEAFFAFKMRAGAGWARITLTILGALSLLFSLPSLFADGQSTLAVVLVCLRLLLTAAAIVYMYLGAAGHWFSRPGR